MAILSVGGLRGFDAERAQRLSDHLLTLAQTDFFLCAEPGEQLDYGARRIVAERTIKLVEHEAWSYQLIESLLVNRTAQRPSLSAGRAHHRHPTLLAATMGVESVVHNWALRLARCYEVSILGSARLYDFVIRTRPDLVFDGPLPPISTWSREAVSSRYRSYAGDLPFVRANQQYQPADCGGPVTPAVPCRVMDDQFFIVPAKLAHTVFAYGGEATVKYDSMDWCDEPPIRRCRRSKVRTCPLTARRDANEAESFSAMHLTHFVTARSNIPLEMIAVPAYLSVHGVKERDDQQLPTSWDEPLNCNVRDTESQNAFNASR